MSLICVHVYIYIYIYTHTCSYIFQSMYRRTCDHIQKCNGFVVLLNNVWSHKNYRFRWWILTHLVLWIHVLNQRAINLLGWVLPLRTKHKTCLWIRLCWFQASLSCSWIQSSMLQLWWLFHGFKRPVQWISH